MIVPVRQPIPAPRGLLAASVLVAIALASAAPAATPAQKPECPAQEGAALATRFGLTVCDGAAATKVITHEDPQHGARIIALDPEAAGAQEGLVAGDIIYQVAGTRVESGKAAVTALDAARDERIVLINFWRNGAPFIVRIWTK
jgi:hypothetical protein